MGGNDRARRIGGDLLNYIVDGADLTSVANAIRTKGGTSAELVFPTGFISAVQAIQTGIVPTGTKQVTITQNGTVTEDVTNYANAQITTAIPEYNGEIAYTVQISLTNPGMTEYFHSFNIYDSAENKIGEILSPTGSTTIKVIGQSEIYTEISGEDPYIDEESATCTGGVTCEPWPAGFNNKYAFGFPVTGNGTIVIDSILWG